MEIEKMSKMPIGVTLIVVICYIVGEVYKMIFPKKEKRSFIPVLLALLGSILGVLIYYIDKSILFNVNNIFIAILIGIISGTSSTGANQIIKQIFKKEGENKNE